jgi:hypothetical protein
MALEGRGRPRGSGRGRLFSANKAAQIRAEGERAIDRIEAWTAPFDEGWERWRPGSGWSLPQLPEDWDRL